MLAPFDSCLVKPVGEGAGLGFFFLSEQQLWSCHCFCLSYFARASLSGLDIQAYSQEKEEKSFRGLN